MRRIAVTCVLVALLLMLATKVSAGTRLVVFETANCTVCQHFRQDVLPIYWRSARNHDMPLEIVDFDALGTGGHVLRQPVMILPTIVVIKDGREIGRINGHPGRDLFFQAVETVWQAVQE